VNRREKVKKSEILKIGEISTLQKYVISIAKSFKSRFYIASGTNQVTQCSDTKVVSQVSFTE